MSYFTLLIFLSPIPICAVLARYLRAHKDIISGTAAGSIKFRVVGIFAVYLFVLGLTLLCVAPEKLGLNPKFSQELWDYTLNFPYEKIRTKPDPVTGTLFLKVGSHNAIRVNGNLHVGKENKTFRPGGVGFRDSQYIFLVIKPPGLSSNLMASGSVGADASRVELNVATLESESQTIAREQPGNMVITRSWPSRLWMLVTLMPLLVIVLLSWIGPLVVTLAGEVGFLPEWVNRWFGNIAVKISGASAAYIIVVTAVCFLEVGVPQSSTVTDQESTKSCGQISGVWNFDLFHLYPGDRGRFSDYTGSFSVACAENGKATRLIGGISNEMKVADGSNIVPNEGDALCYTKISAGPGNFNWYSVAAVIEDNMIYAIYQSNNKPELGLLYGPTQGGAQQKWNFSDFRDSARQDSQVNHGEMIVFRNELLSTYPCSRIRKN